MPRFFLEHVTNPDCICITGEDARHIGRSLRMRVGEALTVCAEGTDYMCHITSITADTVTLAADSSALCAAEPTVRITLYQAMPKADKLSTIIQKATELGVYRIVPVLTRRCVSRPDVHEFEKKRSRLQKVAEGASKQSGRGIIPEVAPLTDLHSALTEMCTADAALMLYEEGGERMAEMDFTQCQTISVFIGSEGGFDPEEVEIARECGITPIWLGNRILRCETAPTVALSILMHRTGNL